MYLSLDFKYCRCSQSNVPSSGVTVPPTITIKLNKQPLIFIFKVVCKLLFCAAG